MNVLVPALTMFGVIGTRVDVWGRIDYGFQERMESVADSHDIDELTLTREPRCKSTQYLRRQLVWEVFPSRHGLEWQWDDRVSVSHATAATPPTKREDSEEEESYDSFLGRILHDAAP